MTKAPRRVLLGCTQLGHIGNNPAVMDPVVRMARAAADRPPARFGLAKAIKRHHQRAQRARTGQRCSKLVAAGTGRERTCTPGCGASRPRSVNAVATTSSSPVASAASSEPV